MLINQTPFVPFVSFHLRYFRDKAKKECSQLREDNNIAQRSTPEYKCKRQIYPHYIHFSQSMPDPKYTDWEATVNRLSKQDREELNKQVRDYLDKKIGHPPIVDEEVIQYLKGPHSAQITALQQDLSNDFVEASPYTVVIQSAGNDHKVDGYNHPRPVYSTAVRNSQVAGAILVGSLAPNGDKSGFSQEHEEVHIMAPSDRSILTRDEFGTPVKFGGTSGATSLVTGSLLAFSDMSGYHPTAKEAKILLQKTAIPHKYSHSRPRTNGGGMVNAYKMGILGRELNKICQDDQACFSRMIRMDRTYDSLFPADKSLNQSLDRAFPECSQTACGEQGNSSVDCLTKKEVFNRLRTESFKHPKNGEYQRWLSCIYASYGFKETAVATIQAYISNSEHGPYLTDNEHYCKTADTDCVLAPKCNTPYGPQNFKDGFLAFNKTVAENYYNIEYLNKCGKKPQCQDKCRCDNLAVQKRGEKVDPKTGKKVVYWEQYEAKCIGMKCELRTKITQEEIAGSLEKVATPTKSLGGDISRKASSRGTEFPPSGSTR